MKLKQLCGKSKPIVSPIDSKWLSVLYDVIRSPKLQEPDFFKVLIFYLNAHTIASLLNLVKLECSSWKSQANDQLIQIVENREKNPNPSSMKAG